MEQDTDFAIDCSAFVPRISGQKITPTPTSCLTLRPFIHESYFFFFTDIWTLQFNPVLGRQKITDNPLIDRKS